MPPRRLQFLTTGEAVTDSQSSHLPSIPPAGSTWARSRFELWVQAHPDNLFFLRGVLDAFRSAAPARRRRRWSLTSLANKAKTLGVAITLEPNGAVTVRADNTADSAINEWDEVLPHGKH